MIRLTSRWLRVPNTFANIFIGLTPVYLSFYIKQKTIIFNTSCLTILSLSSTENNKYFMNKPITKCDYWLFCSKPVGFANQISKFPQFFLCLCEIRQMPFPVRGTDGSRSVHVAFSSKSQNISHRNNGIFRLVA